ncbi:MAG: ankyrin repeat domain-containing protein [Acutalibacteraceae bacterium]|nr:ankyrin repeat domain-containing protein [Acutalibacteraceae bacterium]
MGVAFTLGFLIILVILVIIAIIILGIGITGLVLLIVGLVKRKKQLNNDGTVKKTPKVLIIVGSVMLSILVLTVLIITTMCVVTGVENDMKEKNSLMNAVEKEDCQLVEKILKDGAPADANEYSLFKGNYVPENTQEYTTPLLYTCENGNYEIAELLLEYGADPNIIGKRGVTPMIEAMDSSSYDIMNLLLENGADIEYKFRGNPYLMRAVYSEDVQAVELLLEYGANPNETDSDGLTPLRYIKKIYLNNNMTQSLEHQEIIDLLIEYGAK